MSGRVLQRENYKIPTMDWLLFKCLIEKNKMFFKCLSFGFSCWVGSSNLRCVNELWNCICIFFYSLSVCPLRPAFVLLVQPNLYHFGVFLFGLYTVCVKNSLSFHPFLSFPLVFSVGNFLGYPLLFSLLSFFLLKLLHPFLCGFLEGTDNLRED